MTKLGVNKGARVLVDTLTAGVTGLIPIDVNIITDKESTVEFTLQSAEGSALAAADKYAESKAKKMMPEYERYEDLVGRVNSSKRLASTNVKFENRFSAYSKKLKMLKVVPVVGHLVMTADLAIEVEGCLTKCRR